MKPEGKHLSNVNKDTKELDERKRDIFHLLVAKLLFITENLRPDNDPTVAHLCTHVKKRDEDDWIRINTFN